MTWFGWDASDYDRQRFGRALDYQAARAAGVMFATYKATEGTRWRHAYLGESLGNARAAGIGYVGAYMVPRTPGGDGSISAQVDYFLAYVDSACPWWRTFPGWFFQMDTEKWSYDPVSPALGAQAAGLIRSRTGKLVIHYAPRWAYGDTVPGDEPLWSSAYGTNLISTLAGGYPGDAGPGWNVYSGRTPLVWQFGSRIIIGPHSTCDGNAVRDTARFAALISGGDDVTAQEIFDYQIYNPLTGKNATFRDYVTSINTSAYRGLDAASSADAHTLDVHEDIAATSTALGQTVADVHEDLAAARTALAALESKVDVLVAGGVDPGVIQNAVAAAVAAALNDPATVAGVAKAVNDEFARRQAE